MKIVIVSGGKKPSYNLLKTELEHSDFLICADSGANCLFEYKIKPDFLIGDFDSIDKKVLEFFKDSQSNIEVFPSDKDFTDTYLSVEKAIELGADSIVLLGCTGSRLDHVLCNMCILYKYLKSKVNISIKDDNNFIFMTDKSIDLRDEGFKYFSLQAYKDTVEGLKVYGAKYELVNYDLAVGDSLTVSNEFLKKEVRLEFNKGNLLVIFSRD